MSCSELGLLNTTLNLSRGSIRVLATAGAGRLGTIPLGGVDGVDAEDVHGVDLLEGAVLGLDEEEVDDNSEGGTASGKDEAVPVCDCVDDVTSAIVREKEG